VEDRVKILRALDRTVEADGVDASFLGIPECSAVAKVGQIDLTRFHNATFEDDWHNPQGHGNNLALLRQDLSADGLLELGSVSFDARGIVQLSSTEIRRSDPSYPERVSNVPVDAPARRIHFLHGVGWFESDEVEVARFVVHYADGSQAEAPVVYGEHVRNWHFGPEIVAAEQGGAEPAWKGPQERWKDHWPDWGVRLYQLTWTNPRPEVAIQSFDFISTMTKSAPFLIAVTVE
jgi:hypothetical protein